MTDLSPEQIQRISDECLTDPIFMQKFKEAMGSEQIPDPSKDPKAHAAFIQRLQRAMTEDSLKEKEGEIFTDEEGTWTYTLPTGVFCIKAADETGKKKVFINICKAEAIAEPMPMTDDEAEESGMKNKDLQFRVPISIGPPRVENDKAGKPSMVYDIAVNPLTLDKCDADYEFKRLVCAMCLYGLKQKHEPTLNTDQYKQPNIKCKGTPAIQRVRLSREKDTNAFNNEINLTKQKNTDIPEADIKLTDSLTPAVKTPMDKKPETITTPQKKLIEVVGEESKTLQPGEGLAAFYNSTKGEGLEDDAVEETPSRYVDVSFEGKYDWSAHRSPELNSYWKTRVDVPAQLIVKISLPEVEHSIKECNVDVSTSMVTIYAIDDEDLANPYTEVELRFPVDADAVSGAKFSKKKKMLTLTLTVILPDEFEEKKKRVEQTKQEDDKEAAEAKLKHDLEEEERQQNHARSERLRKEEEDQQSFNKSLVEASKAMNEGTVPPELQTMVNDMPPSEAQTLLARLLDGNKRGDSVDTLLEKLPPLQINGLCNALREKLGLSKPEEQQKKEDEEQKALKEEAEKQKKKREEAEEEEESYGFDKVAKKLTGVNLKNRFLFALDL